MAWANLFPDLKIGEISPSHHKVVNFPDLNIFEFVLNTFIKPFGKDINTIFLISLLILSECSFFRLYFLSSFLSSFRIKLIEEIFKFPFCFNFPIRFSCSLLSW